jgi:hypothetical protein
MVEYLWGITMSTQKVELEGIWEDILARSADFAGRRVRLIVYTDGPEDTSGNPPISPKNQRMLETFRKWQQTPLTAEEVAVLDEFEQFRDEHPLTFRRIDLK